MITSGPFNQTNKSDLSGLKRPAPKSPISSNKNGSKFTSNVVNLLSDSENEEDNKDSMLDIHHESLFEEKNDTSFGSSDNSDRLELRTTRSQTRAEGSFKQFNDNKSCDENKEDISCGGSQMSDENQMLEDELIDIDQIEVEPLSSVQDELFIQTPSKSTRSSMHKHHLDSAASNFLLNKVVGKEINNEMLEEISANFVLNSKLKSIGAEYKNVTVGQSQIDDSNKSGCFFPVQLSSNSAIKDGFLLRKDNESFVNPLHTLPDGSIIKQKRIISVKTASIKCFDAKTNIQLPIYNDSPLVVIKQNVKNIGRSEIEVQSNDKIILSSGSIDEKVIVIDDDVNNETTSDDTKTLNKTESQSSALSADGVNDNSNVTDNSKSISGLIVGENKAVNDKKKPWTGFSKTLSDVSSKKLANQMAKTKVKNDLNETVNSFIKELDFNFVNPSLSELCNEEIVEMHSFDSEDLNSVIACGSLDSSKKEESKNEINVGQGELTISESDSTIGAFDTFAQITRVSQKSSPKITKSANKELKTAKLDSEHDEGFVQSDEVDDEQSSAASVTGIPILQGVISDVMSEIDSERLVSRKSEESDNEVVEIISSDDESMNSSQQLNSDILKQNSAKICKREVVVKLDKLNKDELKNNSKLGTKLIVDNEYETNCNESENRKINVSKEITSTTDVQRNKVNEISFNKPLEIGNVQSKKDRELLMLKKNDIEINLTGNMDGKLGKTDITKEKVVQDCEAKKVVEGKLQNCNENLSTESKKTKEIEEKRVKDREMKDSEAKKAKETEVKKSFEAEINQRAKEAEIKKGKEIEVRKAKEAEIKRAKDAELRKAKEDEVKKAKETEMKKAFEAELIQRAKEAEIKKAKEVEIKKAKEAEIKKAKEEADLKKVKEAELKKAKEVEMKKAKEAEINKAFEAELVQRAKDAELKRVKEIELEIKRAEEAEIIKVKEVELRRAKEIETKNAIEIELNKVKEAERKETEKQARLKKIREIEENDIEEAFNVESAKEAECTKTRLKTKEDEGKYLQHQSMEESIEGERLRVANVNRKINEELLRRKESEGKVESGINKLKECQSKGISENEIKKFKEIGVKTAEVKAVIRTRSLKIDESPKEISQIFPKNISYKSSSDKSSVMSSTCTDNSTPNNNGNKKQKKDVDSETKSCSSGSNSKVLFDDNKHNSDYSLNSGSNIVKGSNQLDVSGKSKTRSSITESKILDSKSIEPSESNTSLKSYVTRDTTQLYKVVENSYPDFLSTYGISVNLDDYPEFQFKRYSDDNCLIMSRSSILEIIEKREKELAEKRERQLSENCFVKQPEISV